MWRLAAIASASAVAFVAVVAVRRRRRSIGPCERIDLRALPASDVPLKLGVENFIDLDAAHERLGANPVVTHLRSCSSVTRVLDTLHDVIIAFLNSVHERVQTDGESSGYRLLQAGDAGYRNGGVVIQALDALVADTAILDASGGPIFIGTAVVIEPAACIKGPTIIRSGTVIRHGAYLRGDVYLGQQCVVGCECKNVLAMDEVEMPHHGYVGDSLLGYRAHLGCGAVTANLPLFEGSVPAVELDGKTYVLGRRKFGAVLGDRVQLGCGTVTEPGCLLAPHTVCYPLTRLPRGYYGPRELLKNRPHVERVPLHA